MVTVGRHPQRIVGRGSDRARREEDENVSPAAARARTRAARKRVEARSPRAAPRSLPLRDHERVPGPVDQRAATRSSRVQARRGTAAGCASSGRSPWRSCVIAAVVAALADVGASAQTESRSKTRRPTATSLALASDAQANVATRLDVALLLSLAARGALPIRAGEPDDGSKQHDRRAPERATFEGYAGILHGADGAVVARRVQPGRSHARDRQLRRHGRCGICATNRQVASLPTASAAPLG